ncbi:GNAT family N-acetyltransferase [Paenibacillus mendelii]|uniref:GNAT family N-acetyltransferase n=1 Tax=Paenibacillus mendelii TaxID=206163 RepID=A0ABV6JGI7_9BACL|nr:GNAT family N-acetyltransferase [Paenibacillus mendelii]MCQ6557531.1 GNAT family N-acetyltransferase [Paenibacillus mendelii]
MNIESIDLIGVRAKLIPLAREHGEGLYEASKSPEIWTYLPTKIHALADAHTFIEDALRNQELGKELPFTIIDQDSNRIVGSTRLCNISRADRHLEIGWTWYHPSVWRTRMNTECKYLLLKHCFDTLQTVRVQFIADIRNERSNRAIQRLGAVHEGVLRRNRILSDGYVRDSCVHSIIREEWPDVQSRLEGFLRISS